MPLSFNRAWSLGPMGPGFFILFPTPFFYDGGPMDDLIEEEPGMEEEKLDAELFVLMLLMREQC